MKKMVSLLLAAALGMTSAGAVSAAKPEAPAAETAQASQFDESDVVLTFGAISDVHVTADENSTANALYRQALRALKRFAGGSLDAVTISGDICELEYSPSITSEFIRMNDEETPDMPYFFVAGNHDANSDHPEWLPAFFGDLARYTADDLPSAQPLEGNRHAVINGYHFIGVNMMDYYTSQGAKFTQENLDWLAAELASARAAAPGRHIFVYMHPQIANTTWCSDNMYASFDVASVLKDYPEAVVFTGHYHTPNFNNTCVYQKDFTAVNSGNVAFMCIEGGYIDMDGLKVAESYSTSDGMLAQVDGNGNLRLTRIDFNTGRMIKDYMIIPAPDMENKTHLLPYNPEHIALTNEAPAFPSGAGISVKPDASALTVTFTAANDDEMVQYYRFEVRTIPSGITSNSKAYSDFWLYDRVSDFPKEYTKKIPVMFGGDTNYEIKITAVDSYGKESEPLVYNSVSDKPEIPAVTGGNVLNVDFITGAPRNTTALNAAVTATATVTESYFGKAALDCAEGRANVSVPSSVFTMIGKAFTAEAVFAAADAGETRCIIACEKQSKGWALYLNADGALCASIATKSGAVTLRSISKVDAGTLCHAALTCASGAAKLWLNGVCEAEQTFTGALQYSNTAAFSIGGVASGNSFGGLIFRAGVYNSALSGDEMAAACAAVNDSMKYKKLQALYDELGCAEYLASANAGNADAARVCANYAAELTAALKSAAVDDAFIARALKRDAFIADLAVVGAETELPAFEAPVITGVEDGAVYDLTQGDIVPAWTNATAAEMNFTEAVSGARVTEAGEYQLLVRSGGASSVIEFTVTEPAGKKGDLDGDGEITVSDALRALRIAAKLAEATESDLRLGDTDGDGAITVADALAILRVAAKLADVSAL